MGECLSLSECQSVPVLFVVASSPHLVLMLAVVLPPNSSPESGAGAGATSIAWTRRPHNLSLLTMSYLDTMSPQAPDIPTIPTVTYRITWFYNYQSLERTRLAWAGLQ